MSGPIIGAAAGIVTEKAIEFGNDVVDEAQKIDRSLVLQHHHLSLMQQLLKSFEETKKILELPDHFELITLIQNTPYTINLLNRKHLSLFTPTSFTLLVASPAGTATYVLQSGWNAIDPPSGSTFDIGGTGVTSANIILRWGDSSLDIVYTPVGGGTGSNVTITGPLDTGDVAVRVENFPATQSVSGTVAVSNLPATQPVSGTVSVNNFPATQNVDVTNQPSVQGLSADGAVVTGNPVLIGGSDGTNAQTILTDSSGHPIVNINGTVTTSVSNFPATQPISLALPTTLFSGQTNVAVANTAVQLPTHVLIGGFVTGYANPLNTGNVVVGPSGITTSTGEILEPGKPFTAYISNTNLLYVNGANVGDGITWSAS